jgi:hypothetical protein
MSQTFKFKKNTFTYKRLVPAMFLGSDSIPLGLFRVQEEKTRSQLLAEELALNDEGANDEDFDAQLEHILAILSASVTHLNKEKFNAEEYVNYSTDIVECLALIEHVLDASLTLFKEPQEVDKTMIEFIHMMAENYNIPPIEALCTDDEQYTDLDAFIFNTFVFTHAQKIKNKAQKEMDKKSRISQAQRGLKK